jgi:hypothetical protein
VSCLDCDLMYRLQSNIISLERSDWVAATAVLVSAVVPAHAPSLQSVSGVDREAWAALRCSLGVGIEALASHDLG